MYETGTALWVRAFHVMPDARPPENERHAHDYRVEAVLAGELDERAMVVDLDVFEPALRDVAQAMDGKDLEGVLGVEAGAVTVEALARWVHDRLVGPLAAAGAAGDLGIRVWESPTAFGGYRAGVGASTSA